MKENNKHPSYDMSNYVSRVNPTNISQMSGYKLWQIGKDHLYIAG